MRRYKVIKGSDTFNAVQDLYLKMKSVDAAAKKLLKTIPNTDDHYYGKAGVAGGGIAAVCFKGNAPHGWRKVMNAPMGYFPLAKIKENKELIKALVSLPTISYDEINSALGFKWQVTGELVVCKCPGIVWGKSYHLITVHTGAKYTPKPDMIEILESEFEQLEKKSNKK